eukprot:355336-Pelagomonas_calceolata.AAC.4
MSSTHLEPFRAAGWEFRAQVVHDHGDHDLRMGHVGVGRAAGVQLRRTHGPNKHSCGDGPCWGGACCWCAAGKEAWTTKKQPCKSGKIRAAHFLFAGVQQTYGCERHGQHRVLLVGIAWLGHCLAGALFRWGIAWLGHCLAGALFRWGMLLMHTAAGKNPCIKGRQVPKQQGKP